MSSSLPRPAVALADAPAHLQILADLVAFDTVSRNSNLPLIDYAEAVLVRHGARCMRVFNADRTKANLLASFGPLDRPGTILSGHTDVVPVDGQQWSTDPFTLTVRDGRAYGRGTADMKGFVAVCLGLAPWLQSQALDAPVHIALSYDEELGCLGAPDLARAIIDTYGPQRAAIIGEPTGMQTIVGHKGNSGVEIAITGRAAHSSLAPTTVNAIDVARRFLDEFAIMTVEAAGAATDSLYDIPTSTVCVTQIDGGTAMNIVPAACRIVAEFRLLPSLDARAYIDRLRHIAGMLLPDLRQRAAEANIDIRELFSYPGLETSTDDPLVARVMVAANSNSIGKVAYGTEAGVFSTITRSPTIIIGPGSIDQAHKPDEFIALEELESCDRFLRRLLSSEK